MLAVHLLGRPRVDRGGADAYQFRSRKSWALLAYLLLSEQPPARAQLARLLFADADDPLRALRWSLAEIRRALDADGSVDGDPVTLKLADGVAVDVSTVTHGAWTDAVELPGLGAELLDGVVVRGATAAFDTWLLSQRRHLSAAAEAVLHEAALGRLSGGEPEAARDFAVRAAALNPLDENHQALLIRLYRLAGDDVRAKEQYAACVRLFAAEFGRAPGPAVEAALREAPVADLPVADPVAVEAVIEAGIAAISAGAVQPGIGSVRTAVRLADQAGHGPLRVAARLALAEALIHSVGGLDEEGQAVLHEADRIATAGGDLAAAARARAEIGFVDVLRARYDRGERWLDQALRMATGEPSTEAKALTYLGVVASDRADYPGAVRLLDAAVRRAREAGEPRQVAYALCALGRIALLRGDLDGATAQLADSIDLALRHHWLAFVPWPQALLGEAQLMAGDVRAATETTRQAFARACQVGDPCWEGFAQRGLGLLAAESGAVDRAFELLVEARARSKRLTDPYVWLDVYILDTLSALGHRHGHPDTDEWVDTMCRLASRTGMRELTVRSLLHRADRGRDGAAEAAALLAGAIDNPRLAPLLDGTRPAPAGGASGPPRR